jgi:hypothetical protein
LPTEDAPLMADRTESEIQNGILERFGREPDVTLWRNNTGVAQSEVVTRAHLERLLSFLAVPYNPANQDRARHLIKSLLEERPRFTPYGLCVGSSDIIGIVEKRFVPEDLIGRRLVVTGVTLALEVKKPGRKPTKEQQLFLDLVNRRGGVGACVHSEDEAQFAIDRARAL